MVEAWWENTYEAETMGVSWARCIVVAGEDLFLLLNEGLGNMLSLVFCTAFHARFT
jgi:hypothetical protein